MASVTSVHINPLHFALVSLALLLLVRSCAVSMSVSQSSSSVELCLLKTVISCSNEFMRFDCFCVVHKVSSILLLRKAQQVWVEVADRVLLRDFEVHTLHNPRSLLVFLLQLLLIDASHLSLSSVLLIVLVAIYQVFWVFYCFWSSQGNCGI